MNRTVFASLFALVLLAGCATSPSSNPGSTTMPDGSMGQPMPGQQVPGIPGEGVIVDSTTVSVPLEELFNWPVSRINGQKPKIVSGFGPRKVPGETAEKIEPHEGIDIAVPSGTAIKASRGGRVVFTGYSSAYTSRKSKKEKNQLVILLHPDGKSTRYVHIGRFKVTPGQTVSAGQTIAFADGSDEWPESTVLHFEVRSKEGRARDPLPSLQASNAFPPDRQ